MAAVKKWADRVSRAFVDRMAKTPVPWGPLGYVTYKRTYSRLREDLGRTEEYHETVERCVNALLEYGCRMTQEEAETLYEYVYALKCSPPGRMFWQLGTATVARIGGASCCNCFYVNVSDLEAFCFTFDMLMLGGGVGFGVSPSDVFALPKVLGPVRVVRRDGSDVDFIVPDNREGWVELLRRVLHAYFVTGRSFTYSTHCVRGKGERIKGFGGVASGPGELVKGMAQICGVMDARCGKKIRPVDALDIMNIIGSVVVSGNVRRSAQIAVGSPKDIDYMQAKMWSRGNVPNWRGNSNNTVRADDYSELTDAFWDGYKVDADGNAVGENYGLFNLALSRSHGRLIDGPGYRPDPLVDGPNPCAEQSLEHMECCDLYELYLKRLKSRGEFVTAARLGYKVCKTVLQLPFSWAGTQEVVTRNQRMGVGVSGFCEARHFDKDDYTAAYRAMEELDADYSKEIKANRSVKLTTVKPSGTVSLLPGVTPGVHPAYSRYYVRRIRFSADDPIVAACRRNGYHVEPKVEFDGTQDHGTQIVSFPVDVGPDTVVAADVPAVKQMEMQRFLQTYWSDNAVSVTVYYRDEELPAIREKLKAEYRDGVKTISFTKHDKHGYKQAPYEEVGKHQYDELAARCRPITSLEDARQWDIVDSLECAGGSCPVR
jgi:ribonucleoside-triphosphate reductase